MRSSGLRASSLMAMVAIAAAGSGLAAQAMPTLRSAGSGNNHRPTRPRMDTELQREIAAHNEAVERLKAEKKARKLAR